MANRSLNPQVTKEAYRVFVSSTILDMEPYREAVRTALNKADCLAYGFERFTAAAVPPIEVCYNELEASQIYICVLGMRYGSIDENSKKSYTHLEFEKARELGKPTLVFLVDENKVQFSLSEIDMGEAGVKLAEFKKDIKDSKEVTCAFFDSVMSLQESVYRSIEGEIKRQGLSDVSKTEGLENYVLGAKAYRNFVRRPERYKDTLMTLRVRMDGNYGGWMLKEELFEAFSMPAGDALYLTDLWVVGLDSIDVDAAAWRIDCFAESGAADWLDRNEVTQGAVFEGRFMTRYKVVPRIAEGPNKVPIDAKVARLILVEGIRVVERDVPAKDISIKSLSARHSINRGVDMFANQLLGRMRFTDDIDVE